MPAHAYPYLMLREAKRLTQLGASPVEVAKFLNTVATTNPTLRWPYVSRKLTQKWQKRPGWAGEYLSLASSYNKHLVFVYGTLKVGHRNNRLLREGGAVRFGKAVTGRHFVLYDGGFPRLAEPKEVNVNHLGNGGHVTGEVWLVSEPTMAQLDRLEGVPHHYRREKIGVVMEDGSYVEAGAYIIQQPIKTLTAGIADPIEPSTIGHLTWPTREEPEQSFSEP